MHLFDSDAFGGDARGALGAIRELHTELAAVRRSLRESLERENVWRRRVELLERQLRRR